MSEELKACPFCGGQPFDYLDGTVTCDNCIKDNYDGFPEIYKGVWNTRPLEDALRSRVEELENELAEAGKNQSEYHNTVLAQEKEIARLREMVRWRNYPEEKPGNGDYLVIREYGDAHAKTVDTFSIGEWKSPFVVRYLPIPPEVNNE